MLCYLDAERLQQVRDHFRAKEAGYPVPTMTIDDRVERHLLDLINHKVLLDNIGIFHAWSTSYDRDYSCVKSFADKGERRHLNKHTRLQDDFIVRS